MLEGTVFAKARKQDIALEPFPHLVIEDALDHEHCAALLRSRPACTGDPTASNRRTPVPAWMLKSLPHFDPVWRDFAVAHTAPAITQGVAELFADHWPGHLPAPPFDAARMGVIGEHDFAEREILVDARLEVISAVRDSPGSHRRGHVDAANRIFSAMFYLRAEEDASLGGGLELFRFRGEPPGDLDAFELPPETIEPVVTIPYRANTLVVFPNSAAAVHGAEVRAPTRHERAYVFITAEVASDLFCTRRSGTGTETARRSHSSARRGAHPGGEQRSRPSGPSGARD